MPDRHREKSTERVYRGEDDAERGRGRCCVGVAGVALLRAVVGTRIS
jgi:hypothetical protein